MSTFYTIIFLVGILYTLVSFIINGISGALHIGSHIHHMHFHMDGQGHMHTPASGHTHAHFNNANMHNVDIGHDSSLANTFISWLGVLINPLVAVSFLTVFGGVGLLGTLYTGLISPLVFLLSLFSGIIIASMLYKFVAIPLYKSENSTEVSREELTYTKAEVISPIVENGFGQIRYTVNSIRYTAPAKHFKGKAVNQGEEVIIYKIEDNIFYIIEYSDLQYIEVDQI